MIMSPKVRKQIPRFIVLFYIVSSMIALPPWGKGSSALASAPASAPAYWQVITKIPDSGQKTLHRFFHRESLPHWLWILGSSYLLYEYDAPILRETQRIGRQAGLGNKDNTRVFLKMGELPLFRGPTDAGSLMYFFGDGWFHAFIGAGFLWRGSAVHSERAMNTGWAIFHGMGVSTLFNQFLKRGTGRESPNQRTTSRGAWRPFPSFKAYQTQTAKYDAVPSGHVMTASLTLTVIQQNYPEYTYFVTPLGWTLIALLSFQMVNNGVHWVSDYPLGIAMGILFGRIAAKQFPTPMMASSSLKQKNRDSNNSFTEKKFVLFPYSHEDGVGFNLGWKWTW